MPVITMISERSKKDLNRQQTKEAQPATRYEMFLNRHQKAVIRHVIWIILK